MGGKQAAAKRALVRSALFSGPYSGHPATSAASMVASAGPAALGSAPTHPVAAESGQQATPAASMAVSAGPADAGRAPVHPAAADSRGCLGGSFHAVWASFVVALVSFLEDETARLAGLRQAWAPAVVEFHAGLAFSEDLAVRLCEAWGRHCGRVHVEAFAERAVALLPRTVQVRRSRGLPLQGARTTDELMADDLSRAPGRLRGLPEPGVPRVLHRNAPHLGLVLYSHRLQARDGSGPRRITAVMYKPGVDAFPSSLIAGSRRCVVEHSGPDGIAQEFSQGARLIFTLRPSWRPCWDDDAREWGHEETVRIAKIWPAPPG